jgi:YD repeat-containing protein
MVAHSISRAMLLFSALVLVCVGRDLYSQNYQQPADPLRPTYEAYRVDKLATSSEVSSSGDLNIEIPLLTVPNRLGHDWPLVLHYNSNITQRQRASWVGLGWEFELGYVERTVMGRSDDQINGLPNGELKDNANNVARGEREGRLRGMHTTNAPSAQIDTFDQADIYRLNIAGSATEVLPFCVNYETDRFQVSTSEFHPIQYRPWKIEAAMTSSQQYGGFEVRTEDGTQYLFGTSGGAAVDTINVHGGWGASWVNQHFTYPYRWNLGLVVHPDGVTDSILHQAYYTSAPYATTYRHPWDHLQIDRSRSESPGEFHTFGKCVHDNGILDDGFADYGSSWPGKLATETHYALFFVSVTPESVAARSCRLDSIVLFDKMHNLRLGAVRLIYDLSCNNQLTLKSVQRFGIDGGSLPPYEFKYRPAASVNAEYLTSRSRGQSEYPGYETDTFLYGGFDTYARAWHLDTLILSTGGRIAYGYEPVPMVTFDPEGNTAPSQTLRGWGYLMQPRSRLVSKTVTNSQNEIRTWSYEYGSALFDWPSRSYSSAFIPQAFRSAVLPPFNSFEYYKAFRGCPLVHRWVKTTAPDGSTTRTHYTTSYAGNDADPIESRPDLVSTQCIDVTGATILTSRAGERGHIWKVVQNGRDSTITTYLARTRHMMDDLYEYYRFYGPGAKNQFVRNKSIECLPDTIVTIKDGVRSVRIQSYNADGLVERVEESGPSSWKSVITHYACENPLYSPMRERWMLSQPYETVIKENGDTLKLQRILWQDQLLDPQAQRSVFLPYETWQRRSRTDTTDKVRVFQAERYDYNANVLTSNDANGFATNFTYGGSTNSAQPSGDEGMYQSEPPDSSTLPPYYSAYLTATSRSMPGYTLSKTFEYEPLGKVSRVVDENGWGARFDYESLGRLSGIRNADLTMTDSCEYSDNPRQGEGGGFLSITSRSYRSAGESSEATTFADDLGQPFQTRTKLGTTYIVNHSVYDPLWRLQKQYKPFVSTSSSGPDNNIQSQSTAYQTSIGVDAGSRPYTSYAYDSSGRPSAVWAPGMAFASHPATTSYGTNTTADSTGYAVGTLFKTSIRDENGNVNQEFRDHRGNLVLSRVDSAKLRMKTRFRVDALGRVLSVTRPEGDSTTYQYDMLGKLTRKWSPDEGAVEYRYDKAGNLRFSRDANQGTIRYTYRKYDALNRLVEIGEHTPSSDDFTQANADLVTFPTAGTNTTHAVMTYDATCVTGQQNVLGRLSRSISYSGSEATCTTTYSYDREGRVEWIERQLDAFQPIRISYRYDLQGNPVRMDFADTDAPENALSFFYSYDELGRLARVETGLDTTGIGAITQAAYTYAATGQVKRLQLGLAQGVDYTYNVRDWLRKINNHTLSAQSDPGGDGLNGLPTDQFAMVIGYDSAQFVGASHGARPQFNGNISWTMYNTASLPCSTSSGLAPLMGWSYAYDGASRLSKANADYSLSTAGSTWALSPSFDLDTITYDRNGNIRWMKRKGRGSALRNNFTYTYTSLNRVSSIADAADATTSTYTYDGNGNLATENSPGRALSGANYDYRNLLLQAMIGGSVVKYRYDVEGNRLWKETPSGRTRYIRGVDGAVVAVYRDGTLLHWLISAGGKALGRLDP